MAPQNIEEYIVKELISDSSNSNLVRRYLKKLNHHEIIDLFENFLDKEAENSIHIPLSVLRLRNLSCLEATVKFLRESGLSNSRVAELVGRSPQVVWKTYKNAKSKMPGKLDVEFSDFDIPVDVLRSKLSCLESIVVYLVKKGIGLRDIGKMLNRDERTVWTVNNRAKHK